MGNNINGSERLNNLTNANANEDGNPFTIDQIADRIMRELKAPESYKYYCKLARHIPRSTLDYYLTRARNEGDDPKRLFTYLTRQHLTAIGVK